MRRSLNLSWANQEAKPARRVTFVKATWGSDQGCVLKHGELARSGSRELPALGILEREYSKGKPPPPPGGSPAEGLRGGGGGAPAIQRVGRVLSSQEPTDPVFGVSASIYTHLYLLSVRH